MGVTLVSNISENSIEFLLENYLSEEWSNSWYHWLFEAVNFTDIGEGLQARTVFSEGGHEGAGQNVEIVVEVTQETCDREKEWNPQSRFFKKLGFYASYDGCDFDGSFFEVFPQQMTITVYEKE